MKKILLLLFLLLGFSNVHAQEVLITGYIDSSCPQAKGRTIEIYVSGTVNFSGWNLVRQSNGNGYNFNISLNSLGVLTDEFAYITNDENILQAEFNIGNAVVIQTGSINDNGDDAFQIQNQLGEIIDRFGEEGVQPTHNSSWYHKKTYYYRKNGESANYGVFDVNQWIFGDIDLLLGKGLCNGENPYEEIVPFGSFDPALCEVIVSLPYIENFENYIPPKIHNCTTIANSENNHNWHTAFISTNGFNSNVLKYSASEHTGNSWFFTRGIYLEPGIDYELTYKFGNNDPLSEEKLIVGLGTSNQIEAMNILQEHPEILSGMVKTARIIFQVENEEVYYFGFKAASDASQNELYLDDISLNQAPLCLKPINIVVDPIDETSVEINWEAASGSNWKIIYDVGGFDPENQGNEILAENNSSTVLENLMAETSYDLYIKTLCENTESELSEIFSFKTLCVPAYEIYLENFESSSPPDLPDCSYVENGSAGNNWQTTEINDYGFSGKVLKYQADENNPARAWFFTKGVFLESNKEYQLSFIFGNNNSQHTEKLKVFYGNLPQSDKMTVEIIDYAEINQAYVSPSEHIFSVENEGIYYFGFFAYSDANQGDLFIDEIEIKSAPPCLRPTNVFAENITDHSVDLNWTDPHQTGAYEIIYGLYNFDPELEGHTVLTEGESSVSLENLLAGTTYQVYIKTFCEVDEESEFSFVATFTTECVIEDLPYFEDFEWAIIPNLPNCTTSENAGFGNNWETFDDSTEPNPIMNSKTLRYQYDILHAANAWFFTNAFFLSADTYYQLSYKIANNTTNLNFFEKLKVGIGPTAASDSMEIIADHPHITGGIPETHTVVFTVPSDGIYFAGFNAYSNFNASVLYLNDIQIDFGPSCPAPTSLYYENLTNHSVDFSWESLENISQWEIVYGHSGFDPDSESIAFFITEEPTVHLPDLEEETWYEVFIRSICEETETSVWKGPKSFKTKRTPPENNLLCDAIILNLNSDCSSVIFSNSGAFSQPNEDPACFNYPGKTVWFSFQAPQNGEVTIAADFFDPALTAQITVFNAPENCEDLESLGAPIACAGFSSHIFIPDLIPEETYFIRVAANSNKEGDFCVEVKTDPDMTLEKSVLKNLVFFPNPVENILFVQTDIPIEQFILFDLKGRKILKTHPHSSDFSVSASHLQSGIYFMKISAGSDSKIFKIIKK